MAVRLCQALSDPRIKKKCEPHGQLGEDRTWRMEDCQSAKKPMKIQKFNQIKPNKGGLEFD
jgi:hypothetical protein